MVPEHHDKENGGRNQWIIKVKITPQLLKIHLYFFVKGSQILCWYRVNKWLRLTDPQSETWPEEGMQREITSVLSHDKPGHKKPSFE